ncbi:hypothetical protein OB955_21190 [Halobacteria archaeon AArc-m2/3/4]|uniref:Uncharacterized protein n=1 Tax=Natronoglomus mannanivorans TaxID=2979990 RepID=A0AAP2YYF8_9EURY|nr:hypothetical protein [Halobacteria archaeon AArc-xg1-1]MCU4975220.1 hypothetical protein [Halobacteria archaeon AArc-m2/3/4]
MTRDNDRRRSREESRAERPPEEPREPRAGFGAWLTSTVLQTAVAVVGLVAVLFALSMALGIDLLGMLAQALSTQAGQWIAVAFVVLLLTGGAIRTLSYARAPP